MPARDTYHDVVKHALHKDGWTVTDDPLHLIWGRKDFYVDFGAERLLGASKGNAKIAVEVKSFLHDSEMHDLQNALGQYVLYRDVLEETEPDRTIYLAVRAETWKNVFEDPIGNLLLNKQHLNVVVFNVKSEVIVQWKPQPGIDS
jgi:hypothetical protein